MPISHHDHVQVLELVLICCMCSCNAKLIMMQVFKELCKHILLHDVKKGEIRLHCKRQLRSTRVHKKFIEKRKIYLWSRNVENEQNSCA